MKWRRVFTGMEIAAGTYPPRGWGVAYRCFAREEIVTYPIPLNVLVGAAVRIGWWFRAPFTSSERQRLRENAEYWRERYTRERAHARNWRRAMKTCGLDPDTGEPIGGPDGPHRISASDVVAFLDGPDLGAVPPARRSDG